MIKLHGWIATVHAGLIQHIHLETYFNRKRTTNTGVFSRTSSFTDTGAAHVEHGSSPSRVRSPTARGTTFLDAGPELAKESQSSRPPLLSLSVYC
jgi:hypothetical protein